MNAWSLMGAPGVVWGPAAALALMLVMVSSVVWAGLSSWLRRGQSQRLRRRTESMGRPLQSPYRSSASQTPLSVMPLLPTLERSASKQRSWLLRWRQQRLRRALEAQLPDALDYLARALRAGHGFRSALGLLARELPQPLGPELKRVTDEIQYGRPMEQSLRALADRTGSEDVAFFVTSVLIQKDTGGNLADLLGSLSTLIRARVRLHARIRVISAEGRASGWVLGCLPMIVLGLLLLINPGYVSLLWRSEIGQLISACALVSMAVGGLWIRSIVRVRS